MSNLPLDNAALARMHDQALERAQCLRQEAIDDFWRGADAVWQRSLLTGAAGARRAAQRLQARLARRAQARLHPGA